MNKRIRKKKCIGEFKELAFPLEAKYDKLTPETADDFVDKIIEKVQELNMTCGGTFDLDHFDLFVVAGRINTNEAERKQQLIDFIKALPGMGDLIAGEFIDAWYSPIEDDTCGCGCHHDHE